MITPMQTPKTRVEFERAFHFAAEQMREGKFRLPMGADDYIHSLRRVRKLPNGRIDFLSVDERARLHVNMTLNMVAGAFREGLGEVCNKGMTTGGDENEVRNSDSAEAIGRSAGSLANRQRIVKRKAASSKEMGNTTEIKEASLKEGLRKAARKKKSATNSKIKKKPAKKKPAKKKPAKKKPAKKKPAKKKPAKKKHRG